MRSVVFALFLLLSSTVMFSRMAECQQEGNLVAEKRRHDFGEVREGTLVRAEFTVRNEGNGESTFLRPITSCGCTVISSGARGPSLDKPLPAGAETSFIVQFNTTGFSGPVTKTVTLQTNDPAAPTLVFTVAGSIAKRYSLEPSAVNFGELSHGATASKVITLKVHEDGAVIGTPIVTTESISVRELKRSKSELRLEVTATQVIPLGELRDRIVVPLTGTREPSISIPVYAFVKGQLRTAPQQVSFGLVSNRSLLRRRVKVEYFGKGPLIISEIKSTHPAITATAKEVGDKKHYTLEIVLDPTKVTTDVRASVNITTESETVPEVTIPVYAVASATK